MVPNPQDPHSRQRSPENPMFELIPHRKGATNAVPSFITQYGPIREVRFASKPNGTPDGGVHQLFTVVGRSDVFPQGQTNTCTIQALPPTDFETQYKNGNLRFRIPLQLFGLGILDGIQDREILQRHQETAALRRALGISGIPNRSGNDGTIARFGWKAQNKSITMFSGEAYNVEMGVTTDLFPQAVDEAPDCTAVKSEPNDITRMDNDDARNQSFSTLFTRSLTGSCLACLCASSTLPHPCLSPRVRSTESSFSEPTLRILEWVAFSATQRPWLLRPGVKRRPCKTLQPIRSVICWCTTWEPDWRTTSRREARAGTNSEPRRCGVWGSGSTSCTMGGRLRRTAAW